MRIGVLVATFLLALPVLVFARADAPPAPTLSTTQTHLFLPHVAGGSGCGTFHDDFSGETGWFTGERDGLLAELRDGEYRLLVTRPGYVWLVGAPGCDRLDGEAAVDARWVGRPGNFYGLLFAVDERLDRAHLLAVNSEARVWLLFRVHDDGLETIIGPTAHDAIAAGNRTNRLAITRAGGRVVLSINGTAVGDLADPTPGRPTAAGLVAASYTAHAPADARFDNFSTRGTPGGSGAVGSGAVISDQ